MDSCSHKLFSSYPYFEYSSKTNITSGFYPKGLNRIFLEDPLKLKKGYMIGITHYPNTLGVKTNETLDSSDYFINGTTLFRINKTQNSQFFVSSIIELTYYLNREIVTKKYTTLTNRSFGEYYITSNFAKTNYSLSRYYNVTNCKYSKKISFKKFIQEY